MIPVSLISASGMDELNELINNSVLYLEVFLVFLIVYSAVLSAVYFLITRHFLSKKLNLE